MSTDGTLNFINKWWKVLGFVAGGVIVYGTLKELPGKVEKIEMFISEQRVFNGQQVIVNQQMKESIDETKGSIRELTAGVNSVLRRMPVR